MRCANTAPDTTSQNAETTHWREPVDPTTTPISSRCPPCNGQCLQGRACDSEYEGPRDLGLLGALIVSASAIGTLLGLYWILK